MTDKENIRIILIEDDEVIRNGYSFLLGQVDGYEIISTYGSCEEAVKNLRVDNPDVILLDVELPGINGVEAIPLLKSIVPFANILVLTVHDSQKTVFEAFSNGAAGYITKNTPPLKILEAIKEVYEGGSPMSVNIARLVVESFQKSKESPLSKRETEVLKLISYGKNRAQIAEELFINVSTVKTHIKNIYVKLDVDTRDKALKNARRDRLI